MSKEKNTIYSKVKIADVFGAFWRGVKPQKWYLFSLVFLLIVINILAMIIPVFYKEFLDIVSAGGEKSLIVQELLKIIIYIAIIQGIIWIIYRLAIFLNIRYQVDTIARLKQQAYDYLMKHSYNFFSNNFTGSIVQKVNRFARSFDILFDKIIWDIIPLTVKILSIIVIVSFINKWIALVVVGWVLIFVAFNVIFSSWKLKYDILVAQTDSKTTAYLADTITNQNTIQLFGGYRFESKGFKKITNEQARITKINWNLDSLMAAFQSLLGFIAQFLLFYFAIKYWEQGVITIGVFVLLQAYIFTIIDQLWGFTRVVKVVYQSYADAEEMVQILLLPHEIKDKLRAKELVTKKGEIEFENLTFSFHQTRKVLKDINLQIKQGEKIALVGPSGAGKTTFVKLLLRLYSPTAGRILIDGQDISEATQSSLRNGISMVPQDPILFHRTLAENIAYGKRDATEEEIKKAAVLAHCDEFIKGLPYGLETYVGERGIKLSGGERQRVAIARAILKNSPILVLDEATSSLDSHSEMLIQDALNNLMANKTTIVIAHRLSTIQKMDRIIVIDDGKILEQGSHQKLLENENSLYKKLWDLQAGGFIEADKEEKDDNKS